ncbi:hypothetical protein [Caballeronia sp. BR00000012568055]|uniref:hypothetical protein n=1 Tax=Caballeronia sp. BR00000012568055 TaxID=2918761 RepID=UPI0023F8226E|nr:hypothetical protein [Caballeronia sp. BR00000012568055]
MKQRHIHNFLMVSAAFFAINAPVGARADASSFGASSIHPVAQTRAVTVPASAQKRGNTEHNEDDKAV